MLYRPAKCCVFDYCSCANPYFYFSFYFLYGKELLHGHITFTMLRRYYALLQVFIFTMISVLVVENSRTFVGSSRSYYIGIGLISSL